MEENSVSAQPALDDFRMHGSANHPSDTDPPASNRHDNGSANPELSPHSAASTNCHSGYCSYE
ncbi:MAG: hypothetical protein KJZ72_00500 [Anaerolineales bacterium]|nr:hypothetical protein [Anaerolineales bacterium]